MSDSDVENNRFPKEIREEWKTPVLKVYGDIAALTQQACNPNLPNCKAKILGVGDDFSSGVSTLD